MFRFMKTRFSPVSAPLAQPLWLGRLAKVVAACALTAGALHAPTALAAGLQQCTSSGILLEPGGGWTVKAAGDMAGLTNNTAIAEIVFGQTITATNMAPGYTFTFNVNTPGAQNTTKTVKLNTFPGLGLRWTFAGYEDLGNAPLTNPIGGWMGAAVLASAQNWLTATFGGTPGTKIFKYKWKLELVVTDAKVYAGGVGDFAREPQIDEMTVIPVVSDNIPPTSPTACHPTVGNFRQALFAGGAVVLPELPKPPTPTCQFPVGTLNQTVTLSRGSTGYALLARPGSPRNTGSSGETHFQINAQNCGLGARYSLYFSDNNEAGIKEYLKSTGNLANKVNLRMYSEGSSTPVQFGPPPFGSSLPLYLPGVNNSVTADNTSHVHDFTVQYVVDQSFPAATNPPATDLSAQATVTVVYP